MARVDKEYDDLRKESEGWYGDIEEGAERREEGRRSGLQGERGRCSGSYWGREAMEENLDMDRDMYVEDRHGLSAFVCSVEKLADEMEGLIWEIDGIEE